MNNKTNIWVSFNYGGWMISFAKTFELPFAPYYDLQISDGADEENENYITLGNNEYCSTIIGYDYTEKSFYIHVRNVWRRAVRDEVVDSTINRFIQAGWVRMDSENIVALKELMHRESN